ncbi:alpha/beta-hydrolase [Auriculariales sp. MPI-PUGE-AT-0066]|nr:alpha/beta-hydrolase [Auriculariales sp. MPI-PUGE-AT-0066]
MSGSLEHYAPYFRDVAVSRGFKYHLLAIEPQVGKPAMLFLHGFPSTSNDWHHQIEHFHAKGYGLIVPDLLAYGGTDKPLDPTAYSLKAMSQDIIDVIDSLEWTSSARIIVVSHDWGAALHSRLALYHQDRFFASIYLVVGGVPFSESAIDFDVVLPFLEKTFGRPLIAYQEFFTRRPDAAEVIERNFDSFLELIFPEDPTLWERVVTAYGATEDWMRNGKRGTLAAWLSPQDAAHSRNAFLSGGMAAPLNWYKASGDGLWIEEDKELSNNWKQIEHPALFVAATKDPIGLPVFGKTVSQKFHKNVTFAELDTGHWMLLEKPDAVNRELDAFLQTIL